MLSKNHLHILSALLLAIFLILFGRLFQLQIIQGKENRFLAENNRVRKLVIPAQRGIITDRHGEPLVENEPLYLVENKDGEEKSVSRQEALKLEAENKEVEITAQRKYLDKEIFGHLLGFLGEVDLDELVGQKMDIKGYNIGNLLGRSGVEKQYEKELKGRDGTELVEVDTEGRIVRRINRVLPEPGKVLTLAIDKKLQEIAALQMEGKKGAVIATLAQTGEVLVFYSSPSYDPNIFLDLSRRDELVRAIKDEQNLPLLNRVISGIYPPGSTFKIVTSVAGLEEGKITENTLINDPGVLEVNGFKFSNWYFTQYGRTEGKINVVKALARSIDTFFYQLGEMIGAERLIGWTKKFTLDQKQGIDLPGEVAGFVATPEWKEKTRGEKWFLGNTYHLAIGQGDIAITPLAVNLMTSVVATGGKLCIPRVLRLGAVNTPYQVECQDLGIKKEYLEIVKKGMIDACSTGGTGYPFFDFVTRKSTENGEEKNGRVACKTGTAETGDGKTTHAWFTVLAPADKPEIVLTVLVERGGEGSSVAAPIAKEILKEYFKE